jgi:hypothetical protein
MTVGSFGMSIYALVMRERQRDNDIRRLTDMKADYEKDIELYTAVLEGCKKEGFDQVKQALDQAKQTFEQAKLDTRDQAKSALDQAKLNLEQKVDQAKRDKVAQFFGIDLTQQTDQGKETLAIGYNGVVKDYDTQVDQLLNDMDAVYTDMIQKFEDLKVALSDDELIERLKESQKRFRNDKPQGQNETIDSSVRKESMDKLREEFSKTIAQEMNELNASLNKAIADHTALAMLEPFAKKIIQEAEEDEVPITDKKLNRESQTILSTLDLTQPTRTRFKTADEIFQGLKTLIAELQKKAS